MPRKTADQIAEKFGRGVAGAGQDYAAGVQNPVRPWAAATQQGAARWRAGLQAAFANNTFERGVSRTGDAKWQGNALGKGVNNYTAAAASAKDEYAKVAGQIMAAAQAAQSAVANMPNETLDQRIARSAAAQRAVSQAWKGRR